ncbi:MAG TPA: hypothetical protein VLU46_15365, partial [Thermoanaerobaculia bacterium]|nr:hypothetical protein [Thermoanaerobaculia bacterium]
MRPFRSGFSSYATYANALPSGRQAKCCTPLFDFVTAVAPPPFIGSTKICASFSLGDEFQAVTGRRRSRRAGVLPRRQRAHLA